MCMHRTGRFKSVKVTFSHETRRVFPLNVAATFPANMKSRRSSPGRKERGARAWNRDQKTRVWLFFLAFYLRYLHVRVQVPFVESGASICQVNGRIFYGSFRFIGSARFTTNCSLDRIGNGQVRLIKLDPFPRSVQFLRLTTGREGRYGGNWGSRVA